MSKFTTPLGCPSRFPSTGTHSCPSLNHPVLPPLSLTIKGWTSTLSCLFRSVCRTWHLRILGCLHRHFLIPLARSCESSRGALTHMASMRKSLTISPLTLSFKVVNPVRASILRTVSHRAQSWLCSYLRKLHRWLFEGFRFLCKIHL